MTAKIFAGLFISFSLLSHAAESGDDTRASLAAQVRTVRENPVPQVFFEDGGTMYISTTSVEAYNRIMAELNTAVRTHAKAKLIVNRKANMIIDSDGAPTDTKVTVYDDSDDSTPTATSVKNAGQSNANPAQSSGTAKPTKVPGNSN